MGPTLGDGIAGEGVIDTSFMMGSGIDVVVISDAGFISETGDEVVLVTPSEQREAIKVLEYFFEGKYST